MYNETRIYEALLSIADEFADSEGDLPGRLERLRSFVVASIPSFEPKVQTAADIARSIDRMRDARIDGGFMWRGMRFQSRQSDRENIIGASHLASLFIANGGSPDSMRWANPDSDFEWILADNGRTTMSAMDVIDLMQAGVTFKAAQTFYARALKDAVYAAEDPTSVNITDGWPE